MPLIYLLLSRHLEIFQICRTAIVDDNELWGAGISIEYVFDAVDLRLGELKGINQ